MSIKLTTLQTVVEEVLTEHTTFPLGQQEKNWLLNIVHLVVEKLGHPIPPGIALAEDGWVKLPRTQEEAEAMVAVGKLWLHTNTTGV